MFTAAAIIEINCIASFVTALLGQLHVDHERLLQASLYWVSLMSLICLLFLPRVTKLLGAKSYVVKMLSEYVPLCGILLGTKRIRNDAIETKSVEVESSIEQALNGRQESSLVPVDEC
jgi:hypothetical protein